MRTLPQTSGNGFSRPLESAVHFEMKTPHGANRRALRNSSIPQLSLVPSGINHLVANARLRSRRHGLTFYYGDLTMTAPSTGPYLRVLTRLRTRLAGLQSLRHFRGSIRRAVMS